MFYGKTNQNNLNKITVIYIFRDYIIARNRYNSLILTTISKHIEKSFSRKMEGKANQNPIFQRNLLWLWNVKPACTACFSMYHPHTPCIGGHTVREQIYIKFYFLGLFPLFLIHTYCGQSQYVRNFEISRGIFEKTQICKKVNIFDEFC